VTKIRAPKNIVVWYQGKQFTVQPNTTRIEVGKPFRGQIVIGDKGAAVSIFGTVERRKRGLVFVADK